MYSEFGGRHSEAAKVEKIPLIDEVVDLAAGLHMDLLEGILYVMIASSIIKESDSEKIESKRRAQLTMAVARVAHTTAAKSDVITVQFFNKFYCKLLIQKIKFKNKLVLSL